MLRNALLAVLVVVLVWRVHSCAAQIEEKRRIAERQNAVFDSHQLEALSPLPLDPRERRAALRDFSLPPDARFLRAAESLAQQPVKARLAQGRWELSAGDARATVSNPPSFLELMRFVRRLAKAAPKEATALLVPEEQALLDADSADIPRAARAAATLVFLRIDRLQEGDELAARAIELCARDGGSTMALLASGLGYQSEVHTLALDLPAQPLRQFLLGEETPGDHLLTLRRLARQHRFDALWPLVTARDLAQPAVLALLSTAPDFAQFAGPAFALPRVLAGEKLAWRGDAESTLASVIPDRPEAPPDLPPRPAPLAWDYLRTQRLSALSRELDYYELRAQPSAMEKLASLSQVPALIERARREELPVVHEPVAPDLYGGLVIAAGAHAIYGDPRPMRAARELAKRFDSRMEARGALGDLSWSVTRDLRAAQRWLASAGRFDATSEADLRKIFADRARPLDERRDAASRLPERDKLYRALLAEDPDDVETARTLARNLRGGGALVEARDVLRAFFSRPQPFDISTASARSELAWVEYLHRDFAEGAKDAALAQPMGHQGAMQAAALNAAALGNAAEARAQIARERGRYPGATSLADEAEVEWILDDDRAAADALADRTLTSNDFRYVVGRRFARLFKADPSRAAEVGRELQRGRVIDWDIDQLAAALGDANAPEAAFKLREALTTKGDAALIIHLHAAASLERWQGAQARTDYLHARFPPGTADLSKLSMMAFREGLFELLWDLGPEPPIAEEQAWLLRAAALADQGPRAPPAQIARARSLLAGSESQSQHMQIARYLVGLVPEAQVAKLANNIGAACELPYYFSLRANGEGRLADRDDWLAVAVECGRMAEAEYLWAFDALGRIRSGPSPLAPF